MDIAPSELSEDDESAGLPFYRHALVALNEAKVPYLVGGAAAFERYTGIARRMKDLDFFVRREDCSRALETLAAVGYQTELTFTHWLGKAFSEGRYADIIFNSGNGIAMVDDEWFEHAIDDALFDVPVQLCPVEETIWSKAYIMERERYDGADVLHLVLARGQTLDWPRLLRRFGAHWRLLLNYVILFGFAYPSERSRIPDWVTRQLLKNLEAETGRPDSMERVCQGTLLSREQYLADIEHWGYKDARVIPRGNLTQEETDQWTEAIGKEK